MLTLGCYPVFSCSLVLHQLAVIIALLIFSFLMKLYKIIEPRLLEKRGFQPLTPSGSGPGILSKVRQYTLTHLLTAFRLSMRLLWLYMLYFHPSTMSRWNLHDLSDNVSLSLHCEKCLHNRSNTSFPLRGKISERSFRERSSSVAQLHRRLLQSSVVRTPQERRRSNSNDGFSLSTSSVRLGVIYCSQSEDMLQDAVQVSLSVSSRQSRVAKRLKFKRSPVYSRALNVWPRETKKGVASCAIR